jgi:hypothetical protein
VIKCLNGHENADGQRFCGQCGDSLVTARRVDSLSDGIVLLLTLLGAAFAVVFILAMVGAGEANRQHVPATQFLFLSGVGAGPWAIAAIVAWAGAAIRATLLD